MKAIIHRSFFKKCKYIEKKVVRHISIVGTPILSVEGGGVEPPTKFSKRGDLTGLQLLEGVAGKEVGDFFQGEGVAIFS